MSIVLRDVTQPCQPKRISQQPSQFVKNSFTSTVRLPGGQWQVGLSPISLPDARVNLYDLVKKDGYIMYVSGEQTYPKPGGSDGEMAGHIGHAKTLINDIKDLDWVVDGVSFMKATIAHLEQRRKETAIQEGRFTNDQGKHNYVKFLWEGEDLLIDNTNVCHCDDETPGIDINTKLALKMGWLRKVDSGCLLGPNLQQEFMGDQIPDMTKNSDWNDLNDENMNPVFWKVRSFLPDYLQLSMRMWRFVQWWATPREHCTCTRTWQVARLWAIA